MEHDTNIILEEMQKLQVLVRTNNLLLSRFMLELSSVRKELGLPKRRFFFKYELLEDEYQALCDEFGKDLTNKALYKLDRLLLTNKQQCPNNIAKYIRKKLHKNELERNRYNE